MIEKGMQSRLDCDETELKLAEVQRQHETGIPDLMSSRLITSL